MISFSCQSSEISYDDSGVAIIKPSDFPCSLNPPALSIIVVRTFRKVIQ